MSATAQADYLAIAYWGGGSSWGHAKTAFEALRICKQNLEDDWHATGTGAMHVYDITHVDRWWSTVGEKLKGCTSAEPDKHVIVPYLYSVSVELKAAKPKRR